MRRGQIRGQTQAPLSSRDNEAEAGLADAGLETDFRCFAKCGQEGSKHKMRTRAVRTKRSRIGFIFVYNHEHRIKLERQWTIKCLMGLDFIEKMFEFSGKLVTKFKNRSVNVMFRSIEQPAAGELSSSSAALTLHEYWQVL